MHKTAILRQTPHPLSAAPMGDYGAEMVVDENQPDDPFGRSHNQSEEGSDISSKHSKLLSEMSHNGDEILSKRLQFLKAEKPQSTVSTQDHFNFPLLDLSYRKRNETTNGNDHTTTGGNYVLDRYGVAVQKISYNKAIYGDDYSYPPRVLYNGAALGGHLEWPQQMKGIQRQTYKQQMAYYQHQIQKQKHHIKQMKYKNVPIPSMLHDHIPKPSASFLGLYNLGNTCFMNSALQLILSTPSIALWLCASTPNITILEAIVTTIQNAKRKDESLMPFLAAASREYKHMLKQMRQRYEQLTHSQTADDDKALTRVLTKAEQEQYLHCLPIIDSSNTAEMMPMAPDHPLYALGRQDFHRAFCIRRARGDFCALCQLQKIVLVAHGYSLKIDTELCRFICEKYSIVDSVQPSSNGSESTSVNKTFRELPTRFFRVTSHAPKAISNHIRKIMSDMSFFGSQEDAHEFLNSILDQADNHWLESARPPKVQPSLLKLPSSKSKKGENIEKDEEKPLTNEEKVQISKDNLATNYTSPLHQLIGGSTLQSITCSKCRHVSRTSQQFTSLSVDLTKSFKSDQLYKKKKIQGRIEADTKAPSTSLRSALHATLKTEIFDGDNAYFCEKCKIKVRAEKQINLQVLPNTLFLHLNRFRISGMNYDGMPTFSKIRTVIDLPDVLNLSSFVERTVAKSLTLQEMTSSQRHKNRSNSDSGQTWGDYHLAGIVTHQGSIHGGHYYSYIKLDKQWYCIDDDDVYEVDDARALQDSSYVLLYIKDDARTMPFELLNVPPQHTTTMQEGVDITRSDQLMQKVQDMISITRRMEDEDVTIADINKQRLAAAAVATKPSKSKKDAKSSALQPTHAKPQSNDDVISSLLAQQHHQSQLLAAADSTDDDDDSNSGDDDDGNQDASDDEGSMDIDNLLDIDAGVDALNLDLDDEDDEDDEEESSFSSSASLSDDTDDEMSLSLHGDLDADEDEDDDEDDSSYDEYDDDSVDHDPANETESGSSDQQDQNQDTLATPEESEVDSDSSHDGSDDNIGTTDKSQAPLQGSGDDDHRVDVQDMDDDDDDDDDDDQQLDTLQTLIAPELTKEQKKELERRKKVKIVLGKDTQRLNQMTTDQRHRFQEHHKRGAAELYSSLSTSLSSLSSISSSLGETTTTTTTTRSTMSHKSQKKTKAGDVSVYERLKQEQLSTMTVNEQNISYKKDEYDEELDKGRVKKVRGEFAGQDKIWLKKQQLDERIKYRQTTGNKRKASSLAALTPEEPSGDRKMAEIKKQRTAAHLAVEENTVPSLFEQTAQALQAVRETVDLRHMNRRYLVKDVNYADKQTEYQLKGKYKTMEPKPSKPSKPKDDRRPFDGGRGGKGKPFSPRPGGHFGGKPGKGQSFSKGKPFGKGQHHDSSSRRQSSSFNSRGGSAGSKFSPKPRSSGGKR